MQGEIGDDQREGGEPGEPDRELSGEEVGAQADAPGPGQPPLELAEEDALEKVDVLDDPRRWGFMPREYWIFAPVGVVLYLASWML